MKEIWHHTRHDLGRMRWWLLLWFAFSLASPQRFPVSEVPFLHSYGAVVFLFFLSLMLARQHPLAGDRIWWATRPISRHRLAASKLLSLLLVVGLWLIGGGIRLAFEGFHPLAIVLFQIEAVPLTLAAGLGAMLVCGFSRTWRGLATTLLIGVLAVVYLAFVFVGWLDHFKTQWTRAYDSAVAEHLLYYYFLRWLDWNAESGFVGGLVLCTGFWIVLRLRFRERSRLRRGILGLAWVVAGALCIKTALVPGRFPRALPTDPVPETRESLAVKVDEGAVRLVKRKTRDYVRAGRIREEYSMRIPLVAIPADLIAADEMAASDEALCIRLDGETAEPEEIPLLEWSPALVGLNEHGSLWHALGASPEASPNWHGPDSGINITLPNGEQVTRLSGRTVSVSRSEPTNGKSVRITQASLWTNLPYRSGTAFAKGIHRVEIIDVHIAGTSYNEGMATSHYYSSALKLEELRFRLNLNPGNRLFGEPAGTVWHAVHTDAKGGPIASTGVSPYLISDLLSKPGKTQSGSTAFALDKKPSGIAIVRRVPKAKLRFAFEPQTITLPEITEE